MLCQCLFSVSFLCCALFALIFVLLSLFHFRSFTQSWIEFQFFFFCDCLCVCLSLFSSEITNPSTNSDRLRDKRNNRKSVSVLFCSQHRSMDMSLLSIFFCASTTILGETMYLVEQSARSLGPVLGPTTRIMNRIVVFGSHRSERSKARHQRHPNLMAASLSPV